MSSDLILTRVIAIVSDTLPHIDDVGPGTPLVSAGLLDSISLANLILEFEDAFGRELDDGQMHSRNFENPSAIAALYTQLLTDACRSHYPEGEACRP